MAKDRMIISGHQPVYLPGIIVMAKMALVDQWMWVGHCDYQQGSFHSHNWIRSPHGKQKLIVPVTHNSGPSLNEKRIDGHFWKNKHLKSIAANYRDAPFFHDYFPELEAALLMQRQNLSNHNLGQTLADLNIGLTNILCHWLEIETPIHKSEDFGINLYPGAATLMLAEMCTKLEAKHYLSSPGEADYVKPELMNGFAHSYIKFTHPVYEQGHRTFMPNLSVIDLVFNCGPRSGDIVRSSAQI